MGGTKKWLGPHVKFCFSKFTNMPEDGKWCIVGEDSNGSPMYIAVTVGGIKLHQFFIVHAPPFLLCPSSPRELDMIENLDPLGVLISLQPQPFAL